ncbi:uncharacterized protein LOC115869391 [Echinops telfairi]|uniref:Uncharacterized protein LOC115869391 n=1 Tax=Echinops telfairi TaxID=9371 RepID=A0AC55D0Q2_ECHTE|nr:uncharacterized protein LOC115869391 [Echinops telfairi]
MHTIFPWSRPRPARSPLCLPCRIYWGCFYFFPWLRMWRRERSSAHPREQKLEPLRGLMSCLSSGLGPVPQPSGRGLPRRTPSAAAQTAQALKI